MSVRDCYCAYNMREYAEARRLLDLLHRELMDLNPSAARSLEEGLEETLTIHRLRVPPLLRTSLASTNLIESAFSVVETVCRNVKRWQGGDQYLRWVGSGLILCRVPMVSSAGISGDPRPRQRTGTRRSQGDPIAPCHRGMISEDPESLVSTKKRASSGGKTLALTTAPTHADGCDGHAR